MVLLVVLSAVLLRLVTKNILVTIHTACLDTLLALVLQDNMLLIRTIWNVTSAQTELRLKNVISAQIVHTLVLMEGRLLQLVARLENT